MSATTHTVWARKRPSEAKMISDVVSTIERTGAPPSSLQKRWAAVRGEERRREGATSVDEDGNDYGDCEDCDYDGCEASAVFEDGANDGNGQKANVVVDGGDAPIITLKAGVEPLLSFTSAISSPRLPTDTVWITAPSTKIKLPCAAKRKTLRLAATGDVVIVTTIPSKQTPPQQTATAITTVTTQPTTGNKSGNMNKRKRSTVDDGTEREREQAQAQEQQQQESADADSAQSARKDQHVAPSDDAQQQQRSAFDENGPDNGAQHDDRMIDGSDNGAHDDRMIDDRDKADNKAGDGAAPPERGSEGDAASESAAITSPAPRARKAGDDNVASESSLQESPQHFGESDNDGAVDAANAAGARCDDDGMLGIDDAFEDDFISNDAMLRNSDGTLSDSEGASNDDTVAAQEEEQQQGAANRLDEADEREHGRESAPAESAANEPSDDDDGDDGNDGDGGARAKRRRVAGGDAQEVDENNDNDVADQDSHVIQKGNRDGGDGSDQEEGGIQERQIGTGERFCGTNKQKSDAKSGTMSIDDDDSNDGNDADDDGDDDDDGNGERKVDDQGRNNHAHDDNDVGANGNDDAAFGPVFDFASERQFSASPAALAHKFPVAEARSALQCHKKALAARFVAQEVAAAKAFVDAIDRPCVDHNRQQDSNALTLPEWRNALAVLASLEMAEAVDAMVGNWPLRPTESDVDFAMHRVPMPLSHKGLLVAKRLMIDVPHEWSRFATGKQRLQNAIDDAETALERMNAGWPETEWYRSVP